MRKVFALSLVALLLGVGVVAVIETDPGYVLVSYGNYTLETSLWVGLVLLVVALFVFYFLLRLFYRVLGGQRALSSWLGGRHSGRARRNTTRGVISYTEGNWSRARRQLLRGAQGSEAPVLNYLLAARASDRLAEPERVEEYLRRAQEAESGAALAADIVRAEMALDGGDYRRAASALEKSRGGAARHPYVLELLLRAYEGLEDWDALARLLPELGRHTRISREELEAIEARANRRRLLAATDPGELHAVWQDLAAGRRHDAELLRLYVARQVELGDHAGAEKTITRALKRQWDGELVRQYGLIEGGSVSGRLGQSERWLREHPDDAQLLLCLGRLCLREELWGKARDYFERSHRAQPGAEVCAELGRLLIGLGEPKVAAVYYREGLALRADLPRLPQPDKIVADHQLLERNPAA